MAEIRLKSGRNQPANKNPTKQNTKSAQSDKNSIISLTNCKSFHSQIFCLRVSQNFRNFQISGILSESSENISSLCQENFVVTSSVEQTEGFFEFKFLVFAEIGHDLLPLCDKVWSSEKNEVNALFFSEISWKQIGNKSDKIR